MKKCVFVIMVIFLLAVPVSAMEFTAPLVPESGEKNMPDNTDSFGEGLLQIIQNLIPRIRPDLAEATRVSLGVIASVMIVSVLQSFFDPVKYVAVFAGTVTVASNLLMNANSMIRLASHTITEMVEYGKLLLPVMTAALAAQGGITKSAALYAGTSLFGSLLGNLISRLLVPMIYLFLALSAANGAVGEDILKNMRDTIKSILSWILKILLTAFTTYMSITGVISGTTDAATLKATKVAISTVVPVVGGILSDASEAVLVSAALAKNAAGVYGIFAILAIFLEPFLKIGIHYLLLKATGAICSIFGAKRMTDLIGDFSAAMGLLLAMTGSTCILLLVSTVCFLKGVG